MKGKRIALYYTFIEQLEVPPITYYCIRRSNIHYLVTWFTLSDNSDQFSNKFSYWDNWWLNLVPKLLFLEDLWFKSLCLRFFPVFWCWFFPFAFSCPYCTSVCISACKTALQRREEVETLAPFPTDLSFFLGYWWCNNAVGSFVLKQHNIVTWQITVLYHEVCCKRSPRLGGSRLSGHKHAFLFINLSILNDKLILFNRLFDVGPTSWILVFCSLTACREVGVWKSLGDGC